MINSKSMKQFCEENPRLVSVKKTSVEGINVLKYKRRVFYDNLWNEYLEECRGTLVDDNYNVVSMPFTKIYNFRVEDKSPVLSDETPIIAYRKVNGFMGAITYHNGDLLVSTTGSIDSEFCGYIYSLIDRDHYLSVLKDYPDFTFLFEVVHEDDPHIIPEVIGMYLLAIRKKSWQGELIYDYDTLKSLASDLGCYVPTCEITTVGALMESVKNVKHEGFVFYTEDGVAAKVKSNYYLVSKALARKKTISSLNKQLVDEEFYPLIDHLNSIKDEFEALGEQERLNVIRNFFERNN